MEIFYISHQMTMTRKKTRNNLNAGIKTNRNVLLTFRFVDSKRIRIISQLQYIISAHIMK